METHVDLIGNGQAQGDLARSLQNNGKLNFGAMRPFYDEKTDRSYVTIYKGGDLSSASSYVTKPIQTNATLRPYEWRKLDEALLVASRYRLGGIQDLVDNGLVYVLGNAMGTTVLEWHDVSDGMEAVVTMDGITRGPNDRPVYQQNFLPIPIIHVDYEINARELAASRNLGNPLDTTIAEQAARRINEKLEDMLFTNTTLQFGATDDRGRNKVYSYINHPDRSIVHLSIPWDHSAITSKGILQDVMEMKAAAIAAYHYGPYVLYVSTTYGGVLDNDYDVTAPSLMTVRDRILKLSNIQKVVVVDTLPADNVVLVQMTPDVVRLVEGMGLQNIEWQVEGNFISKFKVVRIAVPQIRSDYAGKSGIVHLC